MEVINFFLMISLILSGFTLVQKEKRKNPFGMWLYVMDLGLAFL
uniref:Uncharacterized protein n=1 Tax=Rhizophora mucronata TaxID=61149 RepID=A0A2P2QEE9_RHIMU